MSIPAAFAQYSPPGGVANDFEQTPLISERVYLSLQQGGPMTNNLPISEVPATFAGRRQPGYADDFLYRVHVAPLSFSLGNVAGITTRTLNVWNALAFDVTLSSITATNAEGATIGGHAAPPLLYGPLQERDYTLTVTQAGPAAINASWVFLFSLDGSREVRAFGTRAIAWTWAPDWGAGLTERIEFKTEVMRSFNGREQRRRLRRGARRVIESATLMTNDDRRRLEIALFGWGARSWAVPVWWDGQRTTALSNAGATSVAVSTTDREFTVGGYGMFTSGYDISEIVEVVSFTSSSVAFLRPTGGTWPAGSMFFPAIIAQLDPSIPIERFTAEASVLRSRFTALDPADVSAGTLPLYLAYPVLDSRALLPSSLTANMSRVLEDLDNETATIFRDDNAGIPVLSQMFGWMATTRAAKQTVRALLYMLSGRFGAVWLPTFSSDIAVVANVAVSATLIDIRNQKYALFAVGAPGRNHIRVQRSNGTVSYHKITGSTEISAAVERITISPHIGAALNVSDIAQISYMTLHRPAADSFEIAHTTGEAFSVQADFVSFRHDL